MLNARSSALNVLMTRVCGMGLFVASLFLVGCIEYEPSDSNSCHFSPYDPEKIIDVDSVRAFISQDFYDAIKVDEKFNNFGYYIQLYMAADSVNIFTSLDTNDLSLKVGDKTYTSFSRRREECNDPDCYTCKEASSTSYLSFNIDNVLDTSINVAIIKNGVTKRSWKISVVVDTNNPPKALFDTIQAGLKILLAQNGKVNNSRFYMYGASEHVMSIAPTNSGDTLLFVLDSTHTKLLAKTNYSEADPAKKIMFCQTNVENILKIKIDTSVVGGKFDYCQTIDGAAGDLIQKYANF